MTKSQLERLTARVQGRVQGVGFRYFAKGEAKRLGLRGWVRNERDGSVLVVAEGSRADLEKLADRLKAGPPSSVVRDVGVRWESGSGEFSGFRVAF